MVETTFIALSTNPDGALLTIPFIKATSPDGDRLRVSDREGKNGVNFVKIPR